MYALFKQLKKQSLHIETIRILHKPRNKGAGKKGLQMSSELNQWAGDKIQVFWCIVLVILQNFLKLEQIRSSLLDIHNN